MRKMPGPAAMAEDGARDNLSAHMSWVQARLPGARVVDADDLLLVDSGFSCDTFNFAARARFQQDSAATRIREALAFFARTGHPFSWWVGPSDLPADLGTALADASLRPAEEELAMEADLAGLPAADIAPHGLRIERIGRTDQVAQFAAILAANWSPPDPLVAAYYEAAAPVVLRPDSPLHLYLGYLDGRPVATAELCLAGGVAGLYNIATLADQRRRGFGTALTARPLLDAREMGIRTGVLQASAEGQGVYARLGFRVTGRYLEYQRR